jgi:tRNA threonylcarbamoyladenosine biosynthesis protein TsaB
MLSLAVDTSTLSGSLAILREERVVAMLGAAVEETYSSRLFRHLRFLLGENNLRIEDFDLFSVASGPGSFTGLRVGLAAVKGWAEAFGKPVAGVSLLEAIAARSTSHQPLVAAVLDARRGQLFAGVYGRVGVALERKGEEVVLEPGECLEWLSRQASPETLALVSPTPEVIFPALENSPFRGRMIERVSGLLADEIGRLGYRMMQRGAAAGALELDANYVRRSDAEVKWKD